MAVQRLTERYALKVGKVNLEAGTIDDVLICGTESANGRDYPPAVFRRDFAVYEGRPVNCDHGRESTVERRFGWFSNVKVGEDGRPRGRLNALKTHPMFARVMEAAERNPALFGFSHVAMCDTKRGPAGRETVEAIKSIESIDLVADPATTRGFFEHREQGVSITIKQLVEWVAKHPNATTEQALKIKRLAEMDGMGDVPMDAPADNAEAGSEITTAFETAMMSLVKKLLESGTDQKTIMKTLKNLADSHNTATAKPEAEPEEEEPAAEGKKPKATDPFAVLSECTKAGYQPGAAELKVLASMPAEDRAAYLTEQKAKAANANATHPSGASRRPGAGTAGNQTQKTQESAPPTDGKAFGKWVSE